MKDKCLERHPTKFIESTWNTCGCTDHAPKVRLANRVTERQKGLQDIHNFI